MRSELIDTRCFIVSPTLTYGRLSTHNYFTHYYNITLRLSQTYCHLHSLQQQKPFSIQISLVKAVVRSNIVYYHSSNKLLQKYYMNVTESPRRTKLKILFHIYIYALTDLMLLPHICKERTYHTAYIEICEEEQGQEKYDLFQH